MKTFYFLNDNIIQAAEVKVKAAEMSGEAVDNKTKLDIIKHEEAIIAAEKEQKEREAKVGELRKDRPVGHVEMAMTTDIPNAAEIEERQTRLKVGYYSMLI